MTRTISAKVDLGRIPNDEGHLAHEPQRAHCHNEEQTTDAIGATPLVRVAWAILIIREQPASRGRTAARTPAAAKHVLYSTARTPAAAKQVLYSTCVPMRFFLFFVRGSKLEITK